MRVEDFINENRDKIVDVHWNETIQQYVKNLSLSEVLLNELKKEDYFNLSSNFFESINNDIRTYVEKAINPNYEIAIVGAIKAGKSTLINALIGDDLASVSVTPETATLTKFKYSKENYVKIKFYTQKEWDRIWEDAKEKEATIFLNEYKALGAERVKDSLLGRKEEFKEFLNLNELKKEIERWTSSQSKEHYFVKEIEIGVNTLNLPPQVCLVDTPGLNDIVDYRSEITKKYIDSANAVLVCVNAKTLRNEEALTLAQVFSKAFYKKEKIYVLGTQVDTFNSSDDWEIQRRSWIKYLKEKEYFESEKLAKENIIGISSYNYLMGKKLDDNNFLDLVDDIPKKIISFKELSLIIAERDQNKKLEKIKNAKEKLIEVSKIDLLRDIIDNHLLKNFNETMLKDFIEKYKVLKGEIENFREKHFEILSNKKKEFELSFSDLEEKIKAEKERIRKFEETNDKLSGKVKKIGKEFKKDFSEIEDAFEELEDRIRRVNIE
ncbi:dynamin family protein [Fusobacterium animalis]|uniref:dynamin family protein n=1 Tax=Fusobacterium animalis TaxID=76859 RepID=UPI0034DF8FB6